MIKERIEYYEKENARLFADARADKSDRYKKLLLEIIKQNEAVIRELKHIEKSTVPVVKNSIFSKEELLTIKTDILHIYDKCSLDELEVHKRNLILNKIKKNELEKSFCKCKELNAVNRICQSCGLIVPISRYIEKR